MDFIKKLLDGNERELKKIWKIVHKINDLEGGIQQLPDLELAGKTQEFRERLQAGETLDDVLPEAFAVVREVSKRTIGLRHFDVQMIGGIVLHQGRISEMKTGEGKTLVATLPLYLNALEGRGAHLITVNDYLAKRDARWMAPIFNFLGLSVGIIQHEESYRYDPSVELDDESITQLVPVPRKEAYQADITYGTNNEFGFDYLRDNMVHNIEDCVQRELNYAIVDEVDSILIDEARTPLIISGMGVQSTDLYVKFAKLAKRLVKGTHYTVDEKAHSVPLTEEGVRRVEEFMGVSNLFDNDNIELAHQINQALRAKELYKLDDNYVIKDGEVIIVDEFTGRLMFGRRYSDGLHQAIEAKEGVPVRQEDQTLATITFQNFFRLYGKLAGMTGTAATEEKEFRNIYHLDVVIIPPNRPMRRTDTPDLIYKSEAGKFAAVVRDIVDMNSGGRPILVGTTSIEKSEYLAKLLRKEGLQVNVLNGRLHEIEAKIIAQAGRKGTVTIATNMAGRGVDILLGGNYSKIGETALTHPLRDHSLRAVKELSDFISEKNRLHSSWRDTAKSPPDEFEKAHEEAKLGEDLKALTETRAKLQAVRHNIMEEGILPRRIVNYGVSNNMELARSLARCEPVEEQLDRLGEQIQSWNDLLSEAGRKLQGGAFEVIGKKTLFDELLEILKQSPPAGGDDASAMEISWDGELKELEDAETEQAIEQAVVREEEDGEVSPANKAEINGIKLGIIERNSRRLSQQSAQLLTRLTAGAERPSGAAVAMISSNLDRFIGILKQFQFTRFAPSEEKHIGRITHEFTGKSAHGKSEEGSIHRLIMHFALKREEILWNFARIQDGQAGQETLGVIARRIAGDDDSYASFRQGYLKAVEEFQGHMKSYTEKAFALTGQILGSVSSMMEQFRQENELMREGIQQGFVQGILEELGDDEMARRINANLSEILDRESLKQTCEAERAEIVSQGGLHIIGTERHESRRIDNQLRGRAGRQGDPGSSRFYISLEDDLMRLFGSDRISGLMEKLGFEEDSPLEHSWLTSAIENAQKNVENRNFDIRKTVLEYDEVMNEHRRVIYADRRKILENQSAKPHVMAMICEYVDRLVDTYAPENLPVEEWDIQTLFKTCRETFVVLPENAGVEDLMQGRNEYIKKTVRRWAEYVYNAKEARLSSEIMRQIERFALLKVIDDKWIDHLYAMEMLREGVGLRGYGQKDPRVEYINEAFSMFEGLKSRIVEDTLQFLYKVEIRAAPRETAASHRNIRTNREDGQPAGGGTVRRETRKVGRNDACPCGSGKKYKKCCGR